MKRRSRFLFLLLKNWKQLKDRVMKKIIKIRIEKEKEKKKKLEKLEKLGSKNWSRWRERKKMEKEISYWNLKSLLPLLQPWLSVRLRNKE